jgi:hypothetical protein
MQNKQAIPQIKARKRMKSVFLLEINSVGHYRDNP